MSESATLILPCVEFSELRRRVAETKSASTARYYVAMLNRLEAYNQSSLLDLCRVNSDYVSGFGEYLVREGVTLSTVKLFKMAFRAVMKEAYGSEFKAQFKAAFKDVDSKNETVTNCISCEDLLKVVNCNLENLVVLERVRFVFLYCVVSGGLTFQEFKRSIETGEIDQRLPQQKMFLREIARISGRTFEQYVSKLREEQYAQALEQIGISAGVSVPLRPQSAVDGWISSAKRANIPTGVIASILPSDSSFSGNISLSNQISEEDKLRALEIAANIVVDMKPRWFVMKCYKAAPADIDSELEKSGILSDDEHFSSFIPPEPKAPKSKKSTKKSIIGDMYFFNCKSSTAAAVRKAIKEVAWVYTLAGTSVPAQISDSEMKTFMLLCDVSEGTLAYHFPDINARENNLTIGQEAKIITGNFCGQIGVIKELSNNKYKIVMHFNALSAKVTAEVPIDFIQSLQTK